MATQKQLSLAYAVTALAWYLPMRYESAWLRVIAAIANLMAWLIVVASIVRQTDGNKFWRW